MSRLVRNVALVLGALLAAVIVCEGGLRAVHFTARFEQATNPIWDWVVSDPVLLRKNQPGYHSDAWGFTIDSGGFRGAEIARTKPPGTIRIACMGDSTTFGIWNDGPRSQRATTSYPHELAVLLARRGRRDVEVINAGVLGNTTAEGLRQLLAQLRPLRPDIVVVRYGNNDHTPGRSAAIARFANPYAYRLLETLPDAAYDSELLRLGLQAYQSTFAAPFLPGLKVPPAEFEANLRRFAAIGRRHRIHVLFMDFPYRALERGESPGMPFPRAFFGVDTLAEFHDVHRRYQDIVRRVAATTGTPLLVTEERLRASPEPVFTDYDFSHPNEAGSRLLAELLADELTALGWLGP